jgi:hypothetical protein
VIRRNLSAEELEKLRVIDAFSDFYKEIYGSRPRHINFTELTADEIWDMLNDFYER